MIDISVPLCETTPEYGDDPHFNRRLAADFGPGSPYRLSELKLSAHMGTHVDAPAHFLPDGGTLDMLPPGFFCGPARVAACDEKVIHAAFIAALPPAQGRFLLFKTGNSAFWRDAFFHQDYTALDAGGARALIAANVKGVGIDYLSVGPYDNAAEVHRLLLGAGLAVIEGLDLSRVEPGDYELICLPLRLAGAEGAPARAVLRAL